MSQALLWNSKLEDLLLHLAAPGTHVVLPLVLDNMETTSGGGQGRAEMDNENAVLRAYVAQLETQLYGPWMSLGDDEPPPDY